MSKNILCIVGTRPECIKMAPVIQTLQNSTWAKTTVMSTGQHKELIYQTLGMFDIKPDIDLDVMVPNQSLSELSGRIFLNFEPQLEASDYDLILVQGDTTSVMVASLVSFYRNIPVGHVEAGLRTHNLSQPFPEELNRVITSLVASLHFAPTRRASQNLINERVPENSIYITGNTVIDALLQIANQNLPSEYPKNPNNRLVLVTAHRRENFGKPLEEICDAITRLHNKFTELEFVYPVHPNPNVRNTVNKALSDLERVHLIPPADYTLLVSLMKNCDFILTDSGGIQEEAPALAKPVLVMRNETERPEAVEAGVANLVGTNSDVIFETAKRLLKDQDFYQSLAQGSSPFGDGKAAKRISTICRDFLIGNVIDDSVAWHN